MPKTKITKSNQATVCALFKAGKTLQQLADAYGVSRQRIQQITKAGGLTREDSWRTHSPLRGIQTSPNGNFKAYSALAGVKTYLGSYDSLEAAQKARSEGERQPEAVTRSESRHRVQRPAGGLPKGVSRVYRNTGKRGGKLYQVYRKGVYLGSFDTPEEASKAYEEAEALDK